MIKMTCEDYYETYLVYPIMDYIDEMYWEKNYSAERLFNFLLKHAASQSIVLTDADYFDYDGFFWNVYQNTEKGLS